MNEKLDLDMDEKRLTISQRIARCINRTLPIYFSLSKFKMVTSPQKGYTLAIWNCGHNRHNLRTTLRDIRITIRKNGWLHKTIKKGTL